MDAGELSAGSATCRRRFEDNGIAYVVAVGIDFHVVTKTGTYRAGLLTRTLPPKSWNRRSCGQGAKGPRVYDWAMVATTSPHHVLLVRRSITKPNDLAYFYAYIPEGQPFTLARIVAIAGYRWMVEEDFQQSKARPASTTPRSAPPGHGYAPRSSR